MNCPICHEDADDDLSQFVKHFCYDRDCSAKVTEMLSPGDMDWHGEYQDLLPGKDKLQDQIELLQCSSCPCGFSTRETSFMEDAAMLEAHLRKQENWRGHIMFPLFIMKNAGKSCDTSG